MFVDQLGNSFGIGDRVARAAQRWCSHKTVLRVGVVFRKTEKGRMQLLFRNKDDTPKLVTYDNRPDLVVKL